jgi:hypothetical protein
MSNLERPVSKGVSISVIGAVLIVLIVFATSTGGLSKDKVQLSALSMVYAGIFALVCGLLFGGFLLKAVNTNTKGGGSKSKKNKESPGGMAVAANMFATLTLMGIGFVVAYFVMYAVVERYTAEPEVGQYKVEQVRLKSVQRTGNSQLQCTYTAYFRVNREWVYACTDKAIFEAFESKLDIVALSSTIKHPTGIGIKRVSTVFSISPVE